MSLGDKELGIVTFVHHCPLLERYLVKGRYYVWTNLYNKKTFSPLSILTNITEYSGLTYGAVPGSWSGLGVGEMYLMPVN